MNELKKKRKYLKSKLTRLNTTVTGHDPQTVTHDQVTSYLQRLDEVIDTLKIVHRDIIFASSSDAEKSLHEQDADISKLRAQDLRRTLLDLLDKANARDTGSKSEPPAQRTAVFEAAIAGTATNFPNTREPLLKPPQVFEACDPATGSSESHSLSDLATPSNATPSQNACVRTTKKRKRRQNYEDYNKKQRDSKRMKRAKGTEYQSSNDGWSIGEVTVSVDSGYGSLGVRQTQQEVMSEDSGAGINHNLLTAEETETHPSDQQVGPQISSEIGDQREARGSAATGMETECGIADMEDAQVDIRMRMEPTELDQSEELRVLEIRRNATAHFRKQKKKYEKAIREGPVFVCVCCTGLFFRRSVRKFNAQSITLKHGEEFAAKINFKPNDPAFICQTCYQAANKGVVPKLAATNGFVFPEIPGVIKKLTPLELRLTALRLPFMQIRALGVDRQVGMKGQVVNIHNPVNTLPTVLPRRFNDTATIQLKLVRRRSNVNPVFYETIRPKAVFDATAWLAQTPLYLKENFELSSEWANRLETDEIPFIVDEDEANAMETDTIGNENVQAAEMTGVVQESSAEAATTTWDVPNEEEGIPPGAEETLIDDFDSTLGILYAPGEGQIPRSLLSDRDAELLSFPQIYAGQPRPIPESIKVSSTDIAKSELRRRNIVVNFSYDRRATECTHLLHVYKKLQLERISGNINFSLKLRKKLVGKVTASQLRDEEFVRQLTTRDDAYRILKNIRSAPAYFESSKKKLMSMVRQLSIPTFFITLSAAEQSWIPLLQILHRLLHGTDISEEQASNLSYNDRCDLIRRDPTTTMRYFDHKFQCFWNILMKTNAIFEEYPVRDWFCRLEFQHRDDPSSAKKVEDFVHRFVTTENNEQATLQIHKHTSTCIRRRRRNRGQDSNSGNQSRARIRLEANEECRFGIPFLPFKSTKILHPIPDMEDQEKKQYKRKMRSIKQVLEDCRIDRLDLSFEEFLEKVGITEEEYEKTVRANLACAKLFLRRSVTSAFVNGYNPRIAQAFGSNMDIQFVLDEWGISIYITSYINKAFRGISEMLNKVVEEINDGNDEVRDQFWKIGKCFVRSSEVSCQEAAASLFQIPMVRASRADVFVPTGPIEERVFVALSPEELDELDPESTDVTSPALLNHYSARPTELEDTCLAVFAAYYQYSKSKRNFRIAPENSDASEDEQEERPAGNYLALQGGRGFVRRRGKAKILRFKKYSHALDPHNYFRVLVMLYLPFRNEENDIIKQDVSLLYEANKATIEANRIEFEPNPSFYERYEEAQLNTDALDAELEDEPTQGDYGVVDRQYQSFFAVDDDNDNVDANVEIPESGDHGTGPSNVAQVMPSTSRMRDEDYLKLTRMLNPKQRTFFIHFMRRIRNGDKGFCYYVAGAGGVGKSVLLQAIQEGVNRYHYAQPGAEVDVPCFVACAPTGKASYLVGGATAHSVFNLPMNKGEIKKLDPGVRNSMYAKLRNVRVIAIDEVSMLSSLQLNHMDYRLRDILGSKNDFADVILLAFGDFKQLPPVSGKYVFEHASNSPEHVLAGPKLWRDNFKFYELTQQMRAETVRFAEALRNLGEGTLTEEDIAMFRSREVLEDSEIHDDAIHIFSTNKDVDDYNENYLSQLDTEKVTAFAKDTVIGKCNEDSRQKILRAAQEKKLKDKYGLRNSIMLCISAPYTIVMNIDVSDGLANGTQGILKRILYGRDEDGQRRPHILLMKFDDERTGRKARGNSNDELTPIHVLRKEIVSWPASKLSVVRIMFPIACVKAATVWKVQGGTYAQVAVRLDSRTTFTRQMMYVGASRAKTLEGLYFKGEFEEPAKPSASDKVMNEIRRLRQNPVEIDDFDNVESPHPKIICHNVQSFLAHRQHIITSPVYMNCKIMLFTEPRVKDVDDVNIEGFNCVYRLNSPTSRRHSYGYLVYARPDVNLKFKCMSNRFYKGSHASIVTLEHPKYLFLLIYKSPKMPTKFLRALLREVLIETVDSIVVLVGDLNIQRFSPEGDSLMDLLFEYGLGSCLRSLYSTTSGTLIDYCCTNFRGSVADIVETTFSYHYPVLLNIDL